MQEGSYLGRFRVVNIFDSGIPLYYVNNLSDYYLVARVCILIVSSIIGKLPSAFANNRGPNVNCQTSIKEIVGLNVSHARPL